MSSQTPSPSRDDLAQRFERFARRECHVSPLYERLSLGIADDPELLTIAAQVARHDPPRLLAGNALDLLPAVLATIPRDHAVCVFHTHTINQFPPEDRVRLAVLLAEQAIGRRLHRVALEWLGETHPRLELIAYQDSGPREQLLAYCGSHGEWLEWL
jgi:hypothetical protein